MLEQSQKPGHPVGIVADEVLVVVTNVLFDANVSEANAAAFVERHFSQSGLVRHSKNLYLLVPFFDLCHLHVLFTLFVLNLGAIAPSSAVKTDSFCFG